MQNLQLPTLLDRSTSEGLSPFCLVSMKGIIVVVYSYV